MVLKPPTLPLALLALLPLGCAAGPAAEPADGAEPADTWDDPGPARQDGALEGTDTGAGPPDTSSAPPLRFTAVTFNAGTGPERDHDAPPDDGYGNAQAALADAWYGNGLAWTAAIDDVRAFFAATPADVVAMQEVFWTGDCPTVPAEARAGFVCEGWAEGDPSVVERILGPDFQIACHPGKPDKCLAVRRSFGRIQGCGQAVCVEGLSGATVEGCGRGARVARGVIELAQGGRITVVSVHGSSGFATADLDCRLRQVEQVFVDLGDGLPAAQGEHVVILGDLNTDPGRFAAADRSAARWLDFAGPEGPFRFVSEVGPQALATYPGRVTLDHLLSNAFTGECQVPGATPGLAPISPIVLFDHKPLVCTLEGPHPGAPR